MKSEEAYSILDIVSESEGQGVVLTRSGSICVSFELREPECYSLTPEDIDRRDGMFREAFKFLPDGTYVHKQDVFLKERYCPDIAGGSFLDRADARHFRGRLYVSHTCVMHFVLSGLKSLEKAYISSPLSYKENLHKEDLARLDEFLEGVDNAVGIIRLQVDRAGECGAGKLSIGGDGILQIPEQKLKIGAIGNTDIRNSLQRFGLIAARDRLHAISFPARFRLGYTVWRRLAALS